MFVLQQVYKHGNHQLILLQLFNRDLMYKIGAAQVREFKGKGIEVEKQLFKLLKE